jgi:hypothetical protein
MDSPNASRDCGSLELSSAYRQAGQRAQLRDPYGLSALAIYAGVSFVFIGRSVAAHPSSSYIGRSNDPTVYMWLLRWWPYALAHRLNPMITHLVWAPGGFNLAWTTSMPLPAIAATPLSTVFGPVVAYNILCIAAPAIAAWSCFLLCRRIVSDYAASLVGGYVFGFSAYMLAEARGHLPLTLVFPIPFAVLLVVSRLEDRMSSFRFSLLLAVVLATAFLCWAEMYATMALFGAIAIGLGQFYGDRTQRDLIRRVLAPIASAFGISLIAVLPYLYYFFQPGYPRAPVNSPNAYSADLLNLLVPTQVSAMGNLGLVEKAAQYFTQNSLETGAYLGLPIVAVTFWFAWERWRESVTWLLATFLMIVCTLMVGPRLHVNGNELLGMPWKLAMHLPLLRDALPVRFSVYAFLTEAVIVAIWLSAPRAGGLKIATIILIAIFLCPNLRSSFWQTGNSTPEFFTNDDCHRYLRPGENVIVLPYGINGSSMLWQAATGFCFRMAGGWTSITPHEFQRWPIVNAMLTRSYIPDATLQLRTFMAAHGVRTVLVTGDVFRFWEPMLAPLDSSPIRAGQVVIYSTTPVGLAPDQTISAPAMERRNNLARFSSLLLAAREYLAQKRDLAELTPMRAEQFGLLPAHWVTDPDVRTSNGLYLGPAGATHVAVGIVGSYEGVQPVIARYRAAATEILFPFPRKLIEPPHGDTFMRLLVMIFDRNGLSLAIQSASPAR